MADVLSILIGLMFTCTGCLLLFGSSISADVDDQLTQDFKRFITVMPLREMFPWRITSMNYRTMAGVLQLSSALLLLLTSGVLSTIANMVLMVVMGVAMYSHWAVGDEINKLVPALICFSLLMIRLFLHLRHMPKDKKD
ncbi:transmembrane protein 35B-like [Watersipora subatra]|uniref:transmembrane protein 35B-like n=1 Tax=Watersipora subatra TaxID=2589382 RepID=UPI00355C7114